MSLLRKGVRVDKTFDLSLAATLITVGIPMTKLEKEGKGYSFLFEDDGELVVVMADYWSDRIAVEPKRYWASVQQIKHRINDAAKSSN